MGGLKTSSRKAESECTSPQSRLAEATRKEEEGQHKVSTLEDNSAMLEQQVESLKGMVSSSESQQQEHAKAQLDKISALQKQVEGLKTSSRKAESECTSLQSRLAEATRKEEEAQHKVSTLEDNSAMLEQQVESLKGMVSSSESQQQEHAKAQMDKISALQEQVEG